MAIRGLSLNEEDVYICRDDPCIDKNGDTAKALRDGATGFHFTNIPSGLMAKITDMTQVIEQTFGESMQRIVGQAAQRNREAFRYGVTAFTNLSDNDGRQIECKREVVFEGGKTYHVVADESMDRIPAYILSEVGAHIIKKNSLTEEQAKNFEAALSQSVGSSTSDATNATETSSAAEATDSLGESTDQTVTNG